MSDRGHRRLPLSCGGQAWPYVARAWPAVDRGCPGMLGRALEGALTKRNDGTLNVACRLGGPDSACSWHTSGRNFRAPVLGLHCRCPYGTTLGCRRHSSCTHAPLPSRRGVRND